ncbi:TniQ family protein [Paraburkholderia phenazinium]|uniref:TniQ family protein n=1 Tax=Paraburkholderia phenazinium TaxID=60549 RepID=UPI00158E39A3|nr:TniQ family protein [Paraburkholderia phenazinium]
MIIRGEDSPQSGFPRHSAMVRQAPDPRFYPLVPLGVGHGNCESLVSYLCRLAVEHCVSVDDLVNEGLAQYSPTNFRIWRHFSTWVKDGAVSVFAERRTLALRDALVCATGVQAIAQLSLATLDGVIDLAGMTSFPRRHCALCYEAADFDRLFFPVLWDLKSVNCCPIHGVRLVVSVCGRAADHRRPRWHRVHMPGVCSECGAIAYACNEHAHIAASPAELWAARQSAMLIEAVSGGERFDASAMHESVRELAYMIGDGFPFRAAAVCGFNKARLYDWIHDVRPIKYAPLLALCAAAGTDVLGVVRGKFQRGAPAGFRYTPHHRRPKIRSLDELRQNVAARLIDSDCPSIMSVAASLGCDHTTIHKRLPHEAAMLTSRWRAAQSASSETRRREAKSMIESVARELRANGKAVTVRNVFLASGIHIGKGSRFEEPFRQEQDRSDCVQF